jgi:phage shock protein A
LLDRAEDPKKMLDQLVRDYTNNIAEAEQAVAQTIGNLRLAEQDYEQDVAAVKAWGAKALAASKKADELRAAGNTAEADKMDSLAKVALRKQLDLEHQVQTEERMIATQRETVDKLKSGLAIMKDKLIDLKSRRDSLVARQKSAQAQKTVQTAMSSISILDPTTELGRFEEAVRREEAYAMGQAEVASATLDSQFAELEAADSDFEIDARLAALKTEG